MQLLLWKCSFTGLRVACKQTGQGVSRALEIKPMIVLLEHTRSCKGLPACAKIDFLWC